MSLQSVILDMNFDAVSVIKCSVLDHEREGLNRWLSDGCHGSRSYMENHRREDPKIVLEECKSLIVILFSPQKWSYHTPIRKALKRLLLALQEKDPTVVGRGVVDTAPVMERCWAKNAGLGWIGRNSLLVNEEFGSNFNIGILLINKEIEWPEITIKQDLCKSCQACVEACPSGAIRSDRTIDCRLCLSALSQDLGEIGGCKICQDVCPYNSR